MINSHNDWGRICWGANARERNGKEVLGLSELSSSLLGSFQLLHSSQGSEKDRMIPYVPPSEEVKVLQFEDTLSGMD